MTQEDQDRANSPASAKSTAGREIGFLSSLLEKVEQVTEIMVDIARGKRTTRRKEYKPSVKILCASRTARKTLEEDSQEDSKEDSNE
ncbi:hypothetical protein JHW43_001484 [Diplocarpon mali]|nr:hypothetical protein JHW43_001484 [Diplocarpon mali]